MQHIRIGSRGSDLALWQANHVKKQLEALGSSVEIKIIVTQGDAIQNLSFDKLEGKGFFTKEIETALLNNEIDLAVHSHKDLETDQPKGLVVAAVSEREDPADLLLIQKEKVDPLQLWSLAEQSIIGTSSARRKSQVRGFRPDAEIKDLRGNVPTRIQKLRDGQYDAILLAKAGVDRLKIELSEFHVERLDPEEFIPAPAQGVLALQIREGDQELLKFLEKMNHSVVQERIAVERKVLNLLQGGCQLPLGVYCAENGIVYVSHCQNWEDGANWFEYETDDHESLPEIIVEDLTSIQD
jgi:hydroxymethylbilane synthase